MHYNPDEYRLPLSAEQEQSLIDAATLEYLMSHPGYERSANAADSWAGTVERWSWEDPEWAAIHAASFGELK